MNVAILGHGTVGGGVAELLNGRNGFTVKYVLDKEPIPELGERSVTDFSVILNDGDVDTVVEVMGGVEPAFDYITAAMRAGKNVVTANKQLLATRYDDLTALARETRVGFRSSAAVGGGIPWLPNLQRIKRLGAVNEVCGILNGTTNYILDTMHKRGYDYESVLQDAKSYGYAEADPTADIEGIDIQRKLLISANVAFDASLTEQQVPAAGIAGIPREDIAGFNEMGYVCKLYATAKRVADGAVLAVVDNGDTVIIAVAEYIEIVIQQVHLQNSFLWAHGLHGEALGPDDVELRFLRHGEVIHGNGGEGIGPQALGQPGLVFQNLPLNIADGGVNGTAHIPIRFCGLRPEESGTIPDGDLHGAQLVFFHSKCHEGGRIFPVEILFQLFHALFGVILNGVIQGNFLACVSILHNARSFRGRGMGPSLWSNHITFLCVLPDANV